MNKSELIAQISADTDIAKAQVEKIIVSFLDTITDTLKQGERITLVGFGTFQVSERKATTGVNPQTRERIPIPGRKVARLKFSDTVNRQLN